MTFQSLIYDVRDQAAWITLNRPDALNAMNDQVVDELPRALDIAEADDQVRAIVITGKGRAFSAGADLKHVLGVLQGGDPEKVRAFMLSAYGLFSRVEATEKVTIAAVNGIAAAGGIELLLACDLAIAAESAKIADAHANYGLLPGGGSSIRLPRKIGPTRAKQLLFTGDFLPARTLLDWGLINEVVADDALIGAVDALVARLTTKSPLVLRRMKKLVNDGLDSPLEPALRLEMLAWEAHAHAEDLKEGLSAFSEKRAPRYGGR